MVCNREYPYLIYYMQFHFFTPKITMHGGGIVLPVNQTKIMSQTTLDFQLALRRHASTELV